MRSRLQLSGLFVQPQPLQEANASTIHSKYSFAYSVISGASASCSHFCDYDFFLVCLVYVPYCEFFCNVNV